MSKNVSRTAFIVGALAFLAIGALHTQVHFAGLSGTGLATRFRAIGPVALGGDEVSPWDLFQGVSLLMGFFSAALGLVLIGIWAEYRRGITPHPLVSAAVIVQLVAIAGVGVLYLSNFQTVGGTIGVALFPVPLWDSMKTRRAAIAGARR